MALGAGLFTGPFTEAADETPPAVDLAICLDTSGSMEGLLDAARRKLWDITNELAKARPAPRLRVALFTYGNDGHPVDDGWVRLDSPFTDDLDAVYQKLFALTTNGGTEYVGRVVGAAVDRLDWTASPRALKLIYVAGNESADQDREAPFRDACRRAIARGIQVNSIYCGAAGHGDATAWREVARLADGQFASIDQNRGTVEVATPFDQRLIDLNARLNTTYVQYGAHGRDGAANQFAQDGNAKGLSASASAARTVTKANGLYYNGSWDLVDASRRDGVEVATVREEDLPEEMRKMTPEQRKAHVEAKARERDEVQKEINSVNIQRETFIREAMKAQGLKDGDAFDHAVRTSIRAQASAKGFTFAE